MQRPIALGFLLITLLGVLNSELCGEELVTLELLMNREGIGNVFIDDHRSLVYFETIESFNQSEASFTYPNYFSVVDARRRLLVADLETQSVEPVLPVERGVAYGLLGASAFSPDGSKVLLYRLEDGRRTVVLHHADVGKTEVVDHRIEKYTSHVEWLSDDELIIEVVPSDSKNVLTTLYGHAFGVRSEAAFHESVWLEGRSGSDPIGGGRYARPFAPTGVATALVYYNTETRKSRKLFSGSIDDFAVSPSRRHVAVQSRRKGGAISNGEIYRDGVYREYVSVLDLRDGSSNDFDDVEGRGIRVAAWSGSGNQLLVQISASAKDNYDISYKVLDVQESKLVATIGDSESTPIWAGENLLYKSQDEERWILWSRHNGSLPIVSQNSVSMGSILGVSPQSTYFIAEDGIWQTSFDGASLTSRRVFRDRVSPYRLISRMSNVIDVARWNADQVPSNGIENRVLMTDGTGGKRLLVIPQNGGPKYGDLSFGNTLTVAVSPEAAVFLDNDAAHGSSLVYQPLSTLGESAQKPIELFRFNAGFAGVKPAAPPMKITHSGVTEQELVGWLYLPEPCFDRREDEPGCPMVVIPYIGVEYSSNPPSNYKHSGFYANDPWSAVISNPTSVELLVGRGYAVLLPSIPYRFEDTEPMQDIFASVSSAVDSAIETGLIDPNRLAVSGHSAGGYSALSIASLTNRFSAVVAMGGTYNLTSQYGQFSPPGRFMARYREGSGESGTRAWVETQNGLSMGLPWDRSREYVKNSPIFYASSINSPVMLIHGDLDFVPMAQAEEMFSALDRLGKDVLFVRYWGEGHTLTLPQNTVDMWNRVFKFLEGNGVAPGSKTVH